MTLDQYEEEMARVNEQQYERLMMDADEAEEFNKAMDEMNKELYKDTSIKKKDDGLFDRITSKPGVIGVRDRDGKLEPVYAGEKQKKNQEEGVVNPRHYDLFPDTTVMDVLEKVLSTEELIGFWKGNAIKYRLRMGKKSSQSHVKELQKAKYYEQKLFDFWAENQPEQKFKS